MNTASPEGSQGQLPLDGLRIADFTTFLSGPFSTQILADLGAEVIKIESLEGDSSRSIPPHFVGSDSAYFLSTNRNKRSIAVDLKTADGLAIARELIDKADAVLENFRPGVCKRLGLDPEVIRAKRPQLIWVSISGFGQTGPRSDEPAYDMIVQALSGVMSITGEPGQNAVRLGIPAGDLVAGMYATIGLLAALHQRNLSGTGAIVDISMLDGQLSMLSYQAAYSLIAGHRPKPQSARHDSIATYRSFVDATGRELVVTANTERMWIGLCEVLQLSHLVNDARFVSSAARLENRLTLWPILEEAFRTNRADYWVQALQERGIPAAEIKTVPEALEEARHSGRNMIMEMKSDWGAEIAAVGSPVKIEGLSPPSRFPPRLSQNAEEILRNLLGRSAEEVASLFARGIVGQPPEI